MKKIKLQALILLLLITIPVGLAYVAHNFGKHRVVTKQNSDLNYSFNRVFNNDFNHGIINDFINDFINDSSNTAKDGSVVKNTQTEHFAFESSRYSHSPIEVPYSDNTYQPDSSITAFEESADSADTFNDKRSTAKTPLKEGAEEETVKEKVADINEQLAQIDYWKTVHSIESKQGKLLYRPGNKSRNCTHTLFACGHHQLTVQALHDIGCTSKQCRIDRLDYDKSLVMSKKLLALNEKRLKRNGISDLDDYQKYLIHQQGASGIKNIIKATMGKSVLSSNIKKNMANNSPYSYKQFKKMGSKIAAQTFLKHWQKKWIKEKFYIAKTLSANTDNRITPLSVTTFSDKELHLALNYQF